MIYNRKKRENFLPFCLSVFLFSLFLFFSFLCLFLSLIQISWSFIHCYLSAVNFLLRISFPSWSSFSFLSIFFIFSCYVLNFYLPTFISFLFSFYVSISLHFFLLFSRFISDTNLPHVQAGFFTEEKYRRNSSKPHISFSFVAQKIVCWQT